MPLFPVGDNDPIDIYPIIPSLDGTELIEIANKGTTKLYASTGMIADFVTSAEHDVTATAVIDDNALVRGDGGARGVQSSGITIDDSNNVSGINNLTIAGTLNGVNVFATINAFNFQNYR